MKKWGKVGKIQVQRCGLHKYFFCNPGKTRTPLSSQVTLKLIVVLNKCQRKILSTWRLLCVVYSKQLFNAIFTQIL